MNRCFCSLCDFVFKLVRMKNEFGCSQKGFLLAVLKLQARTGIVEYLRPHASREIFMLVLERKVRSEKFQ